MKENSVGGIGGIGGWLILAFVICAWALTSANNNNKIVALEAEVFELKAQNSQMLRDLEYNECEADNHDQEAVLLLMEYFVDELESINDN